MSKAKELFIEFVKNPHDAAFKRLMGRRDIVIPYLKSKLPQNLSRRCKWEGLTYLPTTFLDEHFTERHADVLLQVPYGKDGVFLLHVLETDINLCVAVDSILVEVHPKPNPSIYADGNIFFCEGNFVTLISDSV